MFAIWTLFIVLSMPPRCILGCPSDSTVSMHIFPHPERFPDQFHKWVEIVGGQLNTPEDYTFFRTKRLCDRHFTEKDRNRNNRLNALAVPSLFLSATPGIQATSSTSTDAVETKENAPVVTRMTVTATPGIQATSSTSTDAVETKENASVVARMTVTATPGIQATSSTSTDAVETKENAPIVTRMTVTATPGIQATSSTSTDAVETKENASVVARMTVTATPGIQATSSTSTDDVETKENAPVISDRDMSVLLEHNYSKVQLQGKYNVAALGVKRASLSLSNYRTEQRQIRSLKQQINALRRRCTSFKNRLASAKKMSTDIAFQRLTKNMTAPAKLFTKMQFSQTKKKHSGRRFSLEEKVMSLSLYKRSPKCYSLLARYFTLPSKKTLQGVLAQVKLGPGLNDKIFDKLKKTVGEMNLQDRLCSVIFDEMSLTPQIHYDMANDTLKGFVSTNTSKDENQIADHALVFMVKGLKANFKQPVAYYFTNSLTKLKLKEIIKEVITKVQSTGLIPLCSVCDQSSVNVGAISELVQESKNELFRQGKEWKHDYFEINNKKIIPLYDVPHLLKGLRNNLITKDLIYADPDDGNKEKKVKWHYLQDIYEADKTMGELRLLHKLTEEHVNPEKIKKMRVKTAAQIFSHSVAVVADHLTARGALNSECRQLIPIVSLIDNLFDTLNCNTFHIPNGKIYKGCVKRSSPHHRLWTKAKMLLKSVKFIAKKKNGDKIRFVTTTIPTTTNFIKTIEGFEALWEILSKKYNFDSMLTRNFNQDPIENFFGNIRSYGARNVAPNVMAFEGAFKALLLNNFNSPHSINANCEKDENDCLQSLDFFLSEKQFLNKDIPEENHMEINEEILMEREVVNDLGQRNYVCGWVLTKCLKNVVKGCLTCKSKLICKEDNCNFDYIKLKEYNKNKQWLTYPSEAAVNLFYEIQGNTISFLKSNVPKNKIRFKIMWITDTLVNFNTNCDKHNEELKKFFMKTTINIIINSWCRDINRILSGKVAYEGDDEVKNIAQLYHNKHKHNKVKK